MPPLEEINLTKEVPKGSKNRKTIAREWLAFLQEETNPISGQIETLSMEDNSLSTIFKAKQGDVSAYKALIWIQLMDQ